tara:strand:- start:3779 stop:4969 length:1191 start_codon:yes stop_codon:yes gene_type:complete
MKIAFLTAGGIAPCLSACIGRLIYNFSKLNNRNEMLAYSHGFKGLLLGNTIAINKETINNCELLYSLGGSPIGNSRVKLSNIDNCIKKGYIKKGQNPFDVSAKQLVKDKIDVLYTIGGDDTNTTAGELAQYLKEQDYDLTVIGLPKTIDNDVYPIKQTLGAWTAAEQGANYFINISNENTTSSRQLIIHEIMGRNCGWLTAATAKEYRRKVKGMNFPSSFIINKKNWDIDAVYIPELKINFESEVSRLKKCMDSKDTVNIFLSEGAGIHKIVSELESSGEYIKKDAFGHLRLDEINSGNWFANYFSKRINADKVLVQKSGYFARSSKSNQRDLDLIFKSVDKSIDYALNGKSGVVGIDEFHDGKLHCISFDRIKGGKEFNHKIDWFKLMLKEIGQK